jgi:hypothetical protein
MSVQPGLTIADAVQRVTEAYQEARRKVERREAGRVEFIQPVKVITDDGNEFTLLTRDLSASGIRLIGTRRLLGQRVTVRIGALDFKVRVLWACPVGDDLVENGGSFLGVSAHE